MSELIALVLYQQPQIAEFVAPAISYKSKSFSPHHTSPGGE